MYIGEDELVLLLYTSTETLGTNASLSDYLITDEN